MFPFYKQHDAMDCGATCLRMIAKHYGRHFSLETLREKCYIDREGASLAGVGAAAESIGLRTMSVKLPYQKQGDTPGLLDVPMPCMAHWKQNHFVVVYQADEKNVWVSDPASGRHKLTRSEFETGWFSDKMGGGLSSGVLMLFETTPNFFAFEGEEIRKNGFGYLFRYLLLYKSLLWQLALGLLLGSIIQLIFPFLAQGLIDIGVETRDISFVWIVLAAQLVLQISQAAVGFIRSWILLHISARVNISLISDFLIKLLKLPIAFFDTKMTGDLLQRIQDHYRIEQFLTASTLNILFSAFNLVIFGGVLLWYYPLIFVVYLVGAGVYILWVQFFLKRRRELDYKRFQVLSDNQNSLLQLIYGIQDIKLHNAELQKRWEWERIQARIFRVNMKTLANDQYQEAGGTFINEIKNVVISFVAAQAVINGSLTLGMLLAVQYIVGQLNGPLNQLLSFFRMAQDAKLSLERLAEIHSKPDESPATGNFSEILPEDRNLVLDNVSFRYNPLSDFVLKNINLVIPQGKTTAIVGSSGSGKTTLLKLLLQFYDPTEGSINLGDASLKYIQHHLWRENVGVVMQDGFIFSDTIAKNIAVGDEVIDKKRLLQAVKVANIQSFIEGLPLGYNTKIGAEGNGISQGQKQRILIARAVYKNPEIILFDEATNALDANNEKVIMENLSKFLEGKTVIVVAHRLSTVKNADQIVVLEKGLLVEHGTHTELTAQKGLYYQLVKNQLELGD